MYVLRDSSGKVKEKGKRIMTMKKIVTEVTGEGLEKLLGEHVMLFAERYIYAGVLAGVDETCVLLRDAQVVYETGTFDSPGYVDAQAIGGGEWYVRIEKIESFGRGK